LAKKRETEEKLSKCKTLQTSKVEHLVESLKKKKTPTVQVRPNRISRAEEAAVEIGFTDDFFSLPETIDEEMLGDEYLGSAQQQGRTFDSSSVLLQPSTFEDFEGKKEHHLIAS